MAPTDETGPTAGRYIPADGAQIYFEEYGAGRPLVLLHGAFSTGAVWRPYIPLLSRHYRMILPDARGHGRTTHTGGEIRLRQLGEDVIAIIKALDLAKPFLFGWSTGGDTALNAALREPVSIGGLVIGGVLHRTSSAYFEGLKALGMVGPGEVDFDLLERRAPELAAMLQAAHSQRAEHWKTLSRQLSYEMMEPTLPAVEALQKMAVPTLIIWGDRDPFVPVEDGLTLYRTLPNAELAVFPGADHDLTRTRVQTVAKAVLAFLHQV